MRACRWCGTEVPVKSGPPCCADCKAERARGRPRFRPCTTCGKAHRSTHNECASCRWKKVKFKQCRTCGEKCSPRASICRPCRMEEMRSEKNPNADGSVSWKGGSRYTTAGYVMIYSPDHPNRSKNKYVAEHTLVMEEVLGRYLNPWENVHHKNGVKDDNRPENLELWAVTQPSGQRAVDLLDWAREIISMYEPIEPLLRAAEGSAEEQAA